MTKKGMSEKLLGAVRAAKMQSGAAPAPQPERARPLRGARRGARQSDQAPPPSLDQPWENLHPERIWPD